MNDAILFSLQIAQHYEIFWMHITQGIAMISLAFWM